MSDIFGQAGITREIALRQRVYPRWIADRKLTQHKADRQIAVLAALTPEGSPPCSK